MGNTCCGTYPNPQASTSRPPWPSMSLKKKAKNRVCNMKESGEKFSAFHKLVAQDREERHEHRTELSFLLFSNLVALRPLARLLLLLLLLLLLFFGPSCCYCCSCWLWWWWCCRHRKRATSCRRASQTPESMPQRLVAISAKTRD